MENEEEKLTEAFRHDLDYDKLIFDFDFPQKQGSTLAYLTICFGVMVVKGFRIMESKFENKVSGNINLVPPGIMSPSRPDRPPYRVFWIDDPDLWVTFQEKAIDAYKKALKENRENEHSY